MNNGNKMDFQFWTGFYDDNNCFEWASNKAYRDMNRTIKFKDKDNDNKQKELRKQWREKVAKAIEDNFKLLENIADFRAWHEKCCNDIREIYSKKVENDEKHNTLSYGQAQKWLNMTIKYLWLLNRLGLLGEDYANIIKNHKKNFDIPLDSYIIRYLAHNKNLPNSKHEFSVSEVISWEKIGGYEWSKIDHYEAYKEYQDQVRNAILSQGYSSPLEWELEYWHEAVRYYNSKE